MKRISALLMVMIMCAALLVGCGRDTPPEETQKPDGSQQDSVTTGKPEVSGEVYDTGEFRALVPDGWAAFPILDAFAEESGTVDTSCFVIIKGGESDLDMFSKPYVRIDYYGPDTMMMKPGSEWYENVEEVAPMQLGSHCWSGFTGEDDYGKTAVLWAEEGDIQYQAIIWLEADGEKISLEDEDVRGILASVEPSDGSADGGNDAPGGGEHAGNYDWWEGSWYGWWAIKNGTGSYAPASDIAWDAYAEIEVYNDNTGLLRLWDTGTARDHVLAYGYDITFEAGASDKGRMVSSRVEFFPNGSWNNGMEAEPMSERATGWTVDPAASTVSHFENMLEITGHYESPENPDDSFDYYIYLRPWGTVWDDVRNGDTSGCLYQDMMPIYHDDWYLSLLYLGYSEPTATFQAGIDAINAYLAEESGGTLDPAAKEGADGIVPLQKLKDLLQWCKKETDYNTTYDEVAAQFGVHGKLIKDDGEYRYYRWLADEDNYIQITFSVKDGVEYWNVTQWNGLK